MSMDSNTILLNAIVKETAAKVIDNLDANAKKEILTEAVSKILQDMKIGWEMSSIIKDEARTFALEYVKRPDVQNRIRQKVIEAAEIVMDGLAKSVAKDIQDNLKSKYNSWVSEG